MTTPPVCYANYSNKPRPRSIWMVTPNTLFDWPIPQRLTPGWFVTIPLKSRSSSQLCFINSWEFYCLKHLLGTLFPPLTLPIAILQACTHKQIGTRPVSNFNLCSYWQPTQRNTLLCYSIVRVYNIRSNFYLTVTLVSWQQAQLLARRFWVRFLGRAKCYQVFPLRISLQQSRSLDARLIIIGSLLFNGTLKELATYGCTIRYTTA